MECPGRNVGVKLLTEMDREVGVVGELVVRLNPSPHTSQYKGQVRMSVTLSSVPSIVWLYRLSGCKCWIMIWQ